METNLVKLSCSTKYLPDWGITEGLRELVQNWQDACVDTKQMIMPTYNSDTLSVTLANPGASLARNVLLFGTTSKIGRDDQAGQFGEGLKLGTLALVRAGASVAIHTQGELWVASLEYDSGFDDTVLAFNITPVEPYPGVKLVVGVLLQEQWEAAAKLFRSLAPCDILCTQGTDVLLNSPGNIYVKGILVHHDKEYIYGYDIVARVDRDRRMVDTYSAKWAIANVVTSAATTGVISAAKLWDMFRSEVKDIEGMNYPSAGVVEILVSEFKRRHGDVVPVNTQHEVEVCVNAGVDYSVLPARLVQALVSSDATDTVDKVIARMRTCVKVTWDGSALKAAERKQLTNALGIAAQAMIGIAVPKCKVVTFRDEKLRGLYSDNTMSIARHLLSKEYQYDLLAVVIHEAAHTIAGDGTREHTSTIEAAWVQVVKQRLLRG